MFNIQGSELIFLLLVALVILGPEKLPDAVRKFTKAYTEFRKMANGFQGKDGQNMPDMPDAFVQEISERYIELYEMVTGMRFVKDESENPLERIERNILGELASS